MKINSDGCVSKNNRMAGCGGVLRNHYGDWICGYTKNIGNGSVMEAEIWGVLLGLRIAAEVKVGKLMVESDAKEIIDYLKGRTLPNGNCQKLIEACWKETDRFEKVEFTHILREQNVAADVMAKLMHETSHDIKKLEHPPWQITCCLWEDKHGIPKSRDKGSIIDLPV